MIRRCVRRVDAANRAFSVRSGAAGRQAPPGRMRTATVGRSHLFSNIASQCSLRSGDIHDRRGRHGVPSLPDASPPPVMAPVRRAERAPQRKSPCRQRASGGAAASGARARSAARARQTPPETCADGCRAREERRMRGGGARRRTATPRARANRGGERPRSGTNAAKRDATRSDRARTQSHDCGEARAQGVAPFSPGSTVGPFSATR